jgi:DNA-binding transcriptional ArsR family regulator
MCICEIVEVVEGANSTVAHHLRILAEGGIAGRIRYLLLI